MKVSVHKSEIANQIFFLLNKTFVFVHTFSKFPLLYLHQKGEEPEIKKALEVVCSFIKLTW